MKTGTNRILLLGLGNDILSDDAIGLHVAREVALRLPAELKVEVRETTEMGLALLDHVAGFDVVVLVDAVQTGKAKPGTVHVFEADELDSAAVPGPHFFGVGQALAFGRRLGMAVPNQVKICAIEVEDPYTIGMQLTPALQAALPGIVERVSVVVTGLAAAGTARSDS